MSTSKTWPGGSTNVTPATYSIPAAGEVNWANLSNFLNALGDGAQSTTFQKFAVRVATTTPVTFSTNDCIVATNMVVASAVAVNLPAGSNKLVAFIVDRKGDARTNNITITPNGAETINGAATLVLNANNQGVMLAYNSSTTDWEVVLDSNPDGGSIGGFTASRAIVSDSGGYLTSATTTATEIGYVNGVTSAIQTQLDAKANNPTTTTGDTVYASNTATPATLARLAIGTANYAYVSTGSAPSWALIANANVDASAAIAVSKLAALTASRAVVTDGSGFISAATTTATEIGYVNGVTSSIQAQLDAKSGNPTTTTGDMLYASNTATPATLARLGIGTANYLMSSSGTLPQWGLLVNANVDAAAAIAVSKLAALTASRAVVSDGSGFITAATTTATEIGYVNGVTSSIQTQLNAKGNNPTTTTGDILYASNTATPATLARLGIGASNTVLNVSAGLPVWSLIANSNVDAAAAIAGTKISPDFGSQNIVTTGTLGISGLSSLTNVRIGTTNLATGLTGTSFRYVGNQKANFLFSDNSTASLDAGANAYYNGTNTLYATANESCTFISLGRATASSTVCLLFKTGTSYSHSAGATVTLQDIGTATSAGLWTLGVTGGTQTHVINGSMSFTGSISGTNLAGTWTPSILTAGGVSGGTGGVTVNSAVYTKIGGIVHLSVSLNYTKSGDVSITMTLPTAIQPTNNFSANTYGNGSANTADDSEYIGGVSYTVSGAKTIGVAINYSGSTGTSQTISAQCNFNASN